MHQQRDQTGQPPQDTACALHACDSNSGIKQSIHDRDACRKVIQFLGARPIARVVHSRPQPCVHTNDRVANVEGPHGVTGHYTSDLQPAPEVHVSVEDAEEDRGGFLHAQEADKGPLAMVLMDSVVVGNGSGGDGLHALVAAVVEAGPMGKTEREWERV